MRGGCSAAAEEALRQELRSVAAASDDATELQHRLSVCAYVYATWTACGVAEEALADTFLDGRADALENYVLDALDASTPRAVPQLRVFACPSSVDEFLCEALLPNRPALLPLDYGEPLFARGARWMSPGGAPHLAALLSAFSPSTPVVATACNAPGTPRRVMTLGEYARWWETRAEQPLEELLYLRDLHLVAASSPYDDFRYTAPPPFVHDWLGEAFDAGVYPSDLRFVYIGPAGTRTPCHVDVHHTFSWSASLAGAMGCVAVRRSVTKLSHALVLS